MIDLAHVDRLIRDVAQDIILPRFRNLKAGEVRTKSSARDFVTIADEEAEKRLTEELTALLPGSCVVGEESVAADKSVLERLAGKDAVWIVDPVDGTANFTDGNPSFGVMVALAKGGETLAGWIHDPLGRRTAMALKGKGAWLEGQRLTVPPPCPIQDMTGAFYSKRTLARLAEAVKKRRCTGCAAFDYLGTLTGLSHFVLFTRLMPWDHAAGVLIHAEAGGFSQLTDGRAYAPLPMEGVFIAASDEESWQTIRSLVD
ncbi:putative Inositol-1-monophosphatase [Rhodospirillaceae bacterium LM-1]|nr:putative Inositol-1-monophosphatase [Rhodospirillaceae bacterium LM-1]